MKWNLQVLCGAVALLFFLPGMEGPAVWGEMPAPMESFDDIPQLRGLAVSTHFARRGGGWRVEALTPMMRKAGFSVVRDEIMWHTVERERGVFELPEVARDWLDAVVEAEMDLIILLTYGNMIHRNPLDPEAFARYATFLVNELRDYPVAAWEIWNEPHNFEFRQRYGGEWNGAGDSPWLEKFAELVEVTAASIRQADPSATIITGAGTPPGNVYLMKRHSASLAEIDGLTEHPYTYRYPPETVPYGGEEVNRRDGVKVADHDHSMTSMFRLLREHSVEHLGRELALWNTEFGYTTFNHHPANANRGLYSGFTEETQAMYHARALVQALAANVENWTIYDLMDDGVNRYEAEHRFGLVRHESEGYHPKPALFAIGRISRLLGGDWVPAAEGPAEIRVLADDLLDRSALRRPTAESVSGIVTGPVVYWFRVGEAWVSFHWQAGRREAEHQAPPVEFHWRGGTSLKPVEAIDTVSGERFGLETAKEGEQYWFSGLELRSSPVAVRWEEP